MKIKRKVSNDAKKLASSLSKKRFESETSESDIPVQQPKSLQSKLSTFKIRTISSIIMVLGFILFLCAGHFYCSLLVLLINICIFKEIISLKRNSHREAKLPYFYIINWYFFGLTEILVTLMFISHKMILSPTLIVRSYLESISIQVPNNVRPIRLWNYAVCSISPKRPIQVPIQHVRMDNSNLCLGGFTKYSSDSKHI